MRYLAGLAVATLLLTFSPMAAAAAPSIPAKPSDFNGDGYVDLAVGAPADNNGAGGVNVIYGSAHGLTATGDQVWSQDSPGIKGVAFGSRYDSFDGERFGAALASGDFDGDGFADLAIGVHGDLLQGEEAGAVNVIYGSAHGLTADGDQLWHRENILDIASSTVVGFSLAVGDFDGDGLSDLAIGIWENGGAVEILLGSGGGLTATGSIRLSPTSPGFPGDPPSAGFAQTLASGDLDGDGHDDLVVADPGAAIGGQVNVIYGDGGPIDFDRSEAWSQDSAGVADIAEYGDRFGQSLAIGDFDGDAHEDLAVSVNETTTAAYDGAVSVLYGSATGITADGNQLWHQDSPGVPGVGESGDEFGTALAAGDLDGDGADDLAIGISHEDVGTRSDQGVVDVLYGDSADGLSAVGAQAWSQDSPGVPGAGELGDWFGAALTAGDFDHSGQVDLAVGAPLERLGSRMNAGVVDVLYGRSTGLSGSRAQSWAQDSPGIKGSSAAGDLLGWAFAP